MASHVARAAASVTHEIHGVVVSAGLMQKTVKVRVGNMTWNKRVRKHFSDPKHYLVHDPSTSLRTGDIVAIAPGWRTSQHKRHVVKSIIAPHGTPLSERPPIPTLDERIAEYEAKRTAKDERRATRRREAVEKEAEERRIKKENMIAKMTDIEKELYLEKRKAKAEKRAAKRAEKRKVTGAHPATELDDVLARDAARQLAELSVKDEK